MIGIASNFLRNIKTALKFENSHVYSRLQDFLCQGIAPEGMEINFFFYTKKRADSLSAR